MSYDPDASYRKEMQGKLDTLTTRQSAHVRNEHGNKPNDPETWFCPACQRYSEQIKRAEERVSFSSLIQSRPR